MKAVKKYVYRPVRTNFYDLADGRLCFLYKRSPQTAAESLGLARWSVAVVKKIMENYPSSKLEMLVVMREFPAAPVTREIREMYQEVLESDQFGHLAFVGEPQSYFKLRIIQTMLIRHRERIRHFLDVEEAKQWLKWEH